MSNFPGTSQDRQDLNLHRSALEADIIAVRPRSLYVPWTLQRPLPALLHQGSNLGYLNQNQACFLYTMKHSEGPGVRVGPSLISVHHRSDTMLGGGGDD